MRPNEMIGEVNFSSIRNWMQSYNPRELFLWIQTIAVHPANMRFQIRFELLLGILFSIPPEKFKGNTLTREDVENLIQDFGNDFSRHLFSVEDYQPFDQLKLIPYFFKNQIRFELLLGILFSIPPEKFKGNTLTRDDVENLIQDFGNDFSRHLFSVEDYQPFDQLKLIPYFFKKRKYYFFYGALERPYEFLGLFGSLYLANNDETDCNELSLLESLFVMSLEFQNHLLEKLSHNEEAKTGSEHVYVPTLEFFDEISPFFEIDPHQMDKLENISVIELGTVKSEGRELIELCATGNLFKTLFVHLSDSNYLLIPQIHLEALFDIGNQALKSSPNKKYLESLILKGFKHRLWKKCHQFFTPLRVVYQILQKDTNQNLAKLVDVIARIDYNKIFLFKAAKHNFEFDSSKQVRNALNELQGVIKKIKDEDMRMVKNSNIF